MATTFHLRQARARLLAGGVVAYPTEGVWGLGCDPDNPHAIARLLDLKGRSPGKGLILVAADIAQLERWLGAVDLGARARLAATWPGPVTWIVPLPGDADPLLTGGRDKIALRVSAHPVVRELCRTFGGAIVSTSANPSGRSAARSRWGVRRYFGSRIDYLLPGALGGRRGPTTIRDLTTDRLLRK